VTQGPEGDVRDEGLPVKARTRLWREHVARLEGALWQGLWEEWRERQRVREEGWRGRRVGWEVGRRRRIGAGHEEREGDGEEDEGVRRAQLCATFYIRTYRSNMVYTRLPCVCGTLMYGTYIWYILCIEHAHALHCMYSYHYCL